MLIFYKFFQNLILKVICRFYIKKEKVIFCKRSILVIILLHDNAQPHIARMILQKHTELQYETLLHPLYSPAFSSTDYHFFKHLDIFLCQNISCSKEEAETVFNDFFYHQNLLESYTSINNLVNHCQKCIDVEGSYFNWLK